MLSSFVVICYLRRSYHLLKNTAMHNGWKGATRPRSPGAHRWGTLTVPCCYSQSSNNIMQYHKVCKLSFIESSVTTRIYLSVWLWTKQLEKLWTDFKGWGALMYVNRHYTTGVSRPIWGNGLLGGGLPFLCALPFLFVFVPKGVNALETITTEDMRQCALCQHCGDSAPSVSFRSFFLKSTFKFKLSSSILIVYQV